MDLDILDPRHDAEPVWWSDLRRRAGLRADWAWPVLAARAWVGRTPLLVSVASTDGVPYAVFCAEWAGLPLRRHGFVRASGGHAVGGLHVRGPGTSALPGWWIADGLPVGDLLGGYVRAMRRALGPRCVGALVRQLSDTDLDGLAAPRRLTRPTEPVAVIDLGDGTYEQWTSRLAAKRRQSLGRTARRVAEAGIELSIVPGSAVAPETMAAILRHNHDKYGNGLLTPLPNTTGYLAALLREPDVFLGRFLDASGELVAVGSILDHPRWPVLRHWSSVPGDDRPNLYLHQYGTVLPWAITRGRRGVILGKGLAPLKQSLGAELVAQYTAVVR